MLEQQASRGRRGNGPRWWEGAPRWGHDNLTPSRPEKEGCGEQGDGVRGHGGWLPNRSEAALAGQGSLSQLPAAQERRVARTSSL